MAKICEKIKELIAERGISQKTLAEVTGLTQSAISHYVNGDRIPRGSNLVKIAQALGTTTDWLLADENIDSVTDIFEAKRLIARSAKAMTREEKYELIQMLMNDGVLDEIK